MWLGLGICATFVGVLGLKDGLRHFHAAEPGLPLVERRRTDTVLAADVRRHDAGILLPQNCNDLLFGKTVTSSSVRPFLGPDSRYLGGVSRGHVIRDNRSF